MRMQTIALASTQFLQPLWDLATAQSSADVTETSANQVDQAISPGNALLAAAQTPTKGAFVKAASPLLEEMLESPFTASKPAEPAADMHCTPGRHALYQDVLEDSSSCQQDLTCCQSCDDMPKCNYANSVMSTQGDASTTEDVTQAGMLDQQALSKGSMQCNAHASGLPAVISDTPGSHPSHDDCNASPQAAAQAAADGLRQHKAAVAQETDAAVAHVAAQDGTGASLPAQSISLRCQPANAQTSGANEVVVASSEGRQGMALRDMADLDITQQPQGKCLQSCAVLPELCRLYDLQFLPRLHFQKEDWHCELC